MPLPDAVLDLIADENLKADPAIKDYNDLGSLVKSHIEQGKIVGSSIRIPGADAKPEEISAYHSKLGRPEAAEKYEYAPPENLAERFQQDDETLNAFRKVAFDNGYTPTQWKAATEFYNTNVLTKSAEGFPTSESTEKLLQGEWKENYEANIAAARKAVAHFSNGSEFGDWLDQSGFGNLPEMARFLTSVGKTLGESQVPDNTHSAAASGSAEAKEKIAVVMSDKAHAYHNRNDMNHKQAVADMEALFKIAHGEEVQFTTAR